MRVENQGGFTLVELMIVIGIVAILAMMAAPSFMNQIRKNQLNTAVHEIMLVASETRSEAVLRKAEKSLSLASIAEVADTSWLPSEHVKWGTAPPLLKYNYFGYLVGANQCFILEHTKDESLKAVIHFNANGAVVYKKNEAAC